MSQLSQVVHQFAVALEKRQQVDVIYLDFSKAFDRVSHEKLLFKLECLGIGGSLLAWFRSYLSGRRHRVVIDNESSDFLPVTCGVPQGSILGSLLFCSMICPMQFQRKHRYPSFLMTQCFRLILGRHDGEKLKDDLNKLFQWSCIWGMEFHAKKCKVLRVARLRSIDDRDYYPGGIKLDPVDVEKDLGILVTHNLSWNSHVDVISSTAQKMLNVLYRTCKDINDISTKKLLYFAWVRSHLEYASVVWSPHAKRNINNLEQVQHRATRFILGRDYSEYERLSKLNLLPLKYRREIHDSVFFFKCLKNIHKLNIFDYVSFRSCTKPLRNVDHLSRDVPFSRTDVFMNSVFVRICRLWNDLPHSIRESNTLSIFRKNLIAFYLHCILPNHWSIHGNF